MLTETALEAAALLAATTGLSIDVVVDASVRLALGRADDIEALACRDLDDTEAWRDACSATTF